jgi:hypothetical protein
MPVGVLMTLPGVERKQYEQINERLFGHYPVDATDAPDGLLVHSAGPAADGWFVYDIWETKGQFERFGKERLTPAVRETLGARQDAGRPEFFKIESLVGVGLQAPVALTSAFATGS